MSIIVISGLPKDLQFEPQILEFLHDILDILNASRLVF